MRLFYAGFPKCRVEYYFFQFNRAPLDHSVIYATNTGLSEESAALKSMVSPF